MSNALNYKILSEIRELLEQNEKEEADKRLLLSEIFSLVADNNGVTWSKVKNTHYKNKDIELSEFAEFTEGEDEISTGISLSKLDTKENTVQLKLAPEPEPIVEENSILGQVVEAIVTKVDKFGAFISTLNGEDGLIHISEISPSQFVSDVSQFFYVGEKITTKAVKHNHGKNYGFSMKAIGGKKPLAEEHNQEEKELSVEKKKEIESIVRYFESFCGNKDGINTESELVGLVNNYGLVNTTLKLAEVINNLNLSKMVLNLLKDGLDESNECLRQG